MGMHEAARWVIMAIGAVSAIGMVYEMARRLRPRALVVILWAAAGILVAAWGLALGIWQHVEDTSGSNVIEARRTIRVGGGIAVLVGGLLVCWWRQRKGNDL